jgi:hypothetical protein
MGGVDDDEGNVGGVPSIEIVSSTFCCNCLICAVEASSICFSTNASKICNPLKKSCSHVAYNLIIRLRVSETSLVSNLLSSLGFMTINFLLGS